MPVNLVFQVHLDCYPLHTLVCHILYFAVPSFLKGPHFSLNVSNLFSSCRYFKVDWYYKLLYFIKIIVCVDLRYGDTSDTIFIDVLFYVIYGIYLALSSASVEAVELINTVLNK